MKPLLKWARQSPSFRIGTVMLVALALALPLAASASSTAGSAPQDQAAFRTAFLTYLTQMQEVAGILQRSRHGRAAAARLGINPTTGVARARESVRRMTPEQLAVLRRAFAATPNWRTHPRMLKAALRRQGFTPNGRVRAFAVGADCDPGPGSPLGITDWYIAKGVSLALEIAHEAIPDDVITSIAQVAAAGLWGIAATAELAIESVNGVETECNDAKLEEFTRTNLDVKVSTRATQASVDAFTVTLNSLSALVNNRLDVAVSTRATQLSLDNFHTAFTANATTVNTKLDGIASSLQSAHTKIDSLTVTVNDQGALALRLQIEADLSEPGNHPVALFEVPAAQGGYLGLVRQIVADTIAKMTAAGQDVGNAAAFLAEGDAAAAAGNYRDAYAAFGKAYRKAASAGGGDA